MDDRKRTRLSSISSLLPDSSVQLLEASGADSLKQIGTDAVRQVVLDVLLGRNLRDSTEFLTRRRLTALNLATLCAFMKGASLSPSFVADAPRLAADILTSGPISKVERWGSLWMLGLTDKGFQNVLRDKQDAIEDYVIAYEQACHEVVGSREREHGPLRGMLELPGYWKIDVSWLLMAYLFNTIGTQTLTIRGSDKSAYGKMFEKLVLGSLLHILGFEHVLEEEVRKPKRVFWLSSRGERRESDATLLYEAGKGVRFDIGFIGRGNPEISPDKISRFERELTMGRKTWYMATIIIVDRIGRKSRIVDMAEHIDGTIVQMSATYWPQDVARVLNEVLGFEHDLVDMQPSDIKAYLQGRMPSVPIDRFIDFSA